MRSDYDYGAPELDEIDEEDDTSYDWDALEESRTIHFVHTLCPCGDGYWRIDWERRPDGQMSPNGRGYAVSHPPGPGPSRCELCDDCVGLPAMLVAGRFCQPCVLKHDSGAGVECKRCSERVQFLDQWEGICAECIDEVLADEGYDVG